ncbi:MAG: hypothetical protein QM733_04465 [Ilumatobacteraceae bacterium]
MASQQQRHPRRRQSRAEREWEAEVIGLSPDQLIDRWTADFDRLSGDVHRIHWNREVFEALDAEIIRSQREGSAFFLEQFLRPMYGDAQVVILRRLGDTDRRSRSFRIMQEEIVLRSRFLTRKLYVCRWAARYGDDPNFIALGHDEFSTKFGKRANECQSEY